MKASVAVDGRRCSHKQSPPARQAPPAGQCSFAAFGRRLFMAPLPLDVGNCIIVRSRCSHFEAPSGPKSGRGGG